MPQAFQAVARSPLAEISGKHARWLAKTADGGNGGTELIAFPALAPKTTPSSNELLARRFAPWTPVQAASPAE